MSLLWARKASDVIQPFGTITRKLAVRFVSIMSKSDPTRGGDSCPRAFLGLWPIFWKADRNDFSAWNLDVSVGHLTLENVFRDSKDPARTLVAILALDLLRTEARTKENQSRN